MLLVNASRECEPWCIFTITSQRTEITATWTVEAVGLTVQGAAGLFENAVRVRRSQSDGTETLLWFAPGVGLVRSYGAEQLELVHWALP